MTLHPLATNFASVADIYERGRPEYAPGAIGCLMAELELERGAAVLDLAAGTGKLARALLAAGLDVVAVEPQAELREVLTAAIGAERVHDGIAEAIPLPDRSVRAVTVGDAFHWFQPQPALAEIRRVLEPGGGLAVISTLPDWRGASWGHEVGQLVMELRPEHPHFDGPPWQEGVIAAGGWTEPRELRVSVPAPADPAKIVDHMASMSWVAAQPQALREHTLARMRELIDSGETPAQLPIHFVISLTTPV